MEVRRATAEDAEAIAGIIAVVAEEGLLASEPPVDTAARAERYRRMLASEARDCAWVLEDEGQIVGHAEVTERPVGVLYLGMTILREGRGRGGGRGLLRTVEQYARECGAHKIDLEVWVENGRAIALYASEGYAVEGVRRLHYRRRNGNLRSALLMARLIDGSTEATSPPGASREQVPRRRDRQPQEQ